MPEMCNTHYNLIDTLIYLDPKNWNVALDIVNEIALKSELGIGYDVYYTEDRVLEVAGLIGEKWGDEHGRFSGAFAATLADCAVFAVKQKYRHEHI